MADITIYIGNKNYSSWSKRPWLALKHAGAAFEEAVIRLDRAAAGDVLAAETTAKLREHSPSGRVPVLRHGTTTVWESLAICEYLSERFPSARLCQRWPAMAEWIAAAKAEPWVIRFDVNADSG